jgi:hypothetical protein
VAEKRVILIEQSREKVGRTAASAACKRGPENLEERGERNK